MKPNNLFLAIAFLLISSTSFSQNRSDRKNDNLLFMLRQTEHISQALKTIDYLHSGQRSSLHTGKVVIIVCGEAVTALSTTDAEAWVEKTNKYPNISIVACGLSLAKFNKTRIDLVKGIDYTENGFIKAF